MCVALHERPNASVACTPPLMLPSPPNRGWRFFAAFTYRSSDSFRHHLCRAAAAHPYLEVNEYPHVALTMLRVAQTLLSDLLPDLCPFSADISSLGADRALVEITINLRRQPSIFPKMVESLQYHTQHSGPGYLSHLPRAVGIKGRYCSGLNK
jgi:hypothetical protein